MIIDTKEIKDKSIYLSLGLGAIESSLRTKIKLYKKRAQEIERYLSKKPEEWGKFQSEFNSEVDTIFRDIMNFEKINLSKGREDRVSKLKRLFINRLRKLFARGPYIEWGLYKPYGYAGDYKIIDDIYQNSPSSTGFVRLFDNYFQMSAICIAVRNRKEDFKKLMIDFANNRRDSSVRIMNVASGPCREISEIFSSTTLLNKDVYFDCYDNENDAIIYAKRLLSNCRNVNFFKDNILRFAAAKNIISLINRKYDFIYATGLFDYFNYKISFRLLRNLRKLLNPKGIIAVANVRDKYSNPSVHFMEWVGDWNLIYRSDEEFKKIFIDAGFKENDLKIQYEQQGVIQYIIGSNKIKE